MNIMCSDWGKSIAHGELKQASLIIYLENTHRHIFACLGREESHCDAVARIQVIQTPE